MSIVLYLLAGLLGVNAVPSHARVFSRGTSTYTPPSVDLPPTAVHEGIRSETYTRLAKVLPKSLHHSVEISTHSWELGALVTSLIEVYNPELSSFGYEFDPNGDVPWTALKIALATLGDYSWSGCPSSQGHMEDDLARYLSPNTAPVELPFKPFVNGDGSLGDPASIGPATWLLAGFTKRSDVRKKLGVKQTAQDYAWAVGGQYHYLLQATKSENGTISQREGHFELWSDMGYMIPPFPAYLGLATKNPDSIKVGINQWILESSALLDTAKNVYRHIHNWDARLWATGNGWMLYGAVRVLGSIRSAGLSKQFDSQVQKIKATMAPVFRALFAELDSDGLIPDYMFENDPVQSKGDAAGTALIVAAYYRFLVLAPELSLVKTTRLAERAFDGVVAQIDDDGWLNRVVDPMGTNGWIVGPRHSPEGQAFLGSMFAARTAAGTLGDVDHLHQAVQSSIVRVGDHVQKVN